MVAKPYPTETYFPHVNHLHSDAHITDHAGSVKTDLVYYPLGQTYSYGGSLVEAHFAGFEQGGGVVLLDPEPRLREQTGPLVHPRPRQCRLRPERSPDLERLRLCAEQPDHAHGPDR
jgi:hypothetical protein